MSQSTIWREGQHLKRVFDGGQVPVVLHLGDHDPSGVDMTRDNIERLELFSELIAGQDFEFERIALNYPQIEQYSPPPNPTKLSDSRANGYIAEFGRSSWELDALDPDVLVQLITSTIEKYQDEDVWLEKVASEKNDRAGLREVANNWEWIVRQIRS